MSRDIYKLKAKQQSRAKHSENSPSDIQIIKYVHLTNKNVSKVTILNLHF